MVSAAVPAPAPGGLRLESDIEGLLAENIPADALSLEDLAALLDSIELRAELRKRKALPPAAVGHAGTSSRCSSCRSLAMPHHVFSVGLLAIGAKQATQASSGDKKRLSIGELTNLIAAPQPVHSVIIQITFQFRSYRAQSCIRARARASGHQLPH